MKIAVTKLITSVGATAWVVAEGMGKGGGKRTNIAPGVY